MVNKSQQDAYVDDAEDTCPLCVEEFDLSDRNFRPCPCGYQVCQFCYNNIKSNMNGLCPACRRPYDDKTIEWKVVSPEEFKADVAAQARRKAAARQKEAERKQVETLNKKHLAGLRVLQKNLVYVVGMDISGDDHALETLRGPNHFGQYGEIIKIVASKAKEGYAGHQSTGIYVTFARKDDAATCIAAVDGTPHDDRVLRAQYGTTKYCSSFLRNERCTNRNCMFLHETGDDNDSFSRQDLSSFNAASSQRSAPPGAAASTVKVTYHNPTQTASPAPAPALAAQTIKAEAMSRSDSGGDGPALPTTATWAKNPQIEQSRRSSQAPSRATPSPKPVNAKLVLPRPDSRAGKISSESKAKSKKATVTTNPQATAEPESPIKTTDPNILWDNMVKSLAEADLTWKFDRKAFDPATLAIIDNHPPLFNLDEGVLQIMKRKEREDQDQANETQADVTPPSVPEDNAQFGGGSLQLGGEPDHAEDFLNQRSSHGQTPFGAFNDPTSFDRQSTVVNEFANLTLGGRSLTPQQQRNISLLKSGTLPQDAATDQHRGPSTVQHHSQLSNPFQAQNQQLNALSRHGRQTSRFTFGSDSGIASGSIKPSANAQMMNSMVHNAQKGFGNTQPGMQSAFYSGVQGPPPGLKASGTPPISGGGMFGQGHGFASAMGGTGGLGSNLGKVGDENTRDLLRNRSSGDASKLDLTDPSILQARMQHPSSAQGSYPGNQPQDVVTFDELDKSFPQLPQITALRGQSRPSTPSKPPGFASSEFPPLASSQKSLGTASPKPVTPAIPFIPKVDAVKVGAHSNGPAINTVDERKTTDASSSSHPLTAPSEAKASEVDVLKASNKGVKDKPIAVLPTKQGIATNAEPLAVSKATPGPVATLQDGMGSKPISSSALTKQGTTATKQDEISTNEINLGDPVDLHDKTQTSSHPPPLVRNPRTLRLVTKVKNEDSPVTSADVESSTMASASSTVKAAAHRPGQNSTQQPSTPTNEFMSENVSLTSASASRPGTPSATSKIHTGPTMMKSKNQIKKERQARAKLIEDLRSEEVSVVDEPVQAPVISRKKKAKKTTASKPRPVTKAASIVADESIPAESEQETPMENSQVQESIEAIPDLPEQPSTIRDEPLDLEHSSAWTDLTVNSILSDLKRQGVLNGADIQYYLNSTGLNTRHDTNPDNVFNNEVNMTLNEEEKDILDCGESIPKQIYPDEWAVILPDRSVLRYLSEDEACQYVDLKLELDQNPMDAFNATDFPIQAWSNFTSNDVWAGLQIAPPVDGNYRHDQYSIFDAPEPLIGEFSSTLLRPHAKDISYGAMYPPRSQAENEEIEARMAMYTLEEAEQTVKASEELLTGARKETEQLEKKLSTLLKKNRKVLKDWQ